MNNLEHIVFLRILWLRPGLTTAFKYKNKSDDSPITDAVVTFEIQEATVEYERASRSSISRTIKVQLSGLLLRDGTVVSSVTDCPDTFHDEVNRDNIDAIEHAGIPETMGDIPKSGFLRRFGQPIVVGAASAVAVYLFFSVRSDEAAS